MKITKSFSKKQKIIVSGVAAVLLVTSAGLGAWFFMRHHDANAVKSQETAMSAMKEQTKKLNQILTSGEPTEKINAYDQYYSSIMAITGSICQSEKDTFYYQYLKEKQSCDSARSKLDAVADRVKAYTNTLKDSVAMSSSIKNVDNINDNTAMYAAWTTNVQTLSSLNVSSNSTDFKGVVIQAATAYRDALKARADADAAQDKAAYDAATAAIDTSFTALTAESEKDTTRLKFLHDEMSRSYTSYVGQ